jgi:uncharacterized protein (DUF58 family)
MAHAHLNAGPIVPGPALRNFARLAGRLFIEPPGRQGGMRSQRRQHGAGLQYLDHRDYVPGDDLRWVSWPLTARLGRPMVRQFQREVATDWVVCIDASSSMVAVGADKWRRAQQIAVAVAYTLLDLGHRAGLLIYGPGVAAICPPGRGQSQFTGIDRMLRMHAPRSAGVVATLGSCLGQLRGASAAFVLSDFLGDDTIQRDLGLLRRACTVVHAMQLLSPAELRLPETGPIELVDVETGARRQVLSLPGHEVDATARAQAQVRNLRAFCAGHGIAFSDASVSLSWQQALLRHLGRAAAR